MTAPRRPKPRGVAAAAGPARVGPVLDGFRAAPGWMSPVTAMLVLGTVAATCYPLGYQLLVDGALAGDAAQAPGASPSSAA